MLFYGVVKFFNEILRLLEVFYGVKIGLIQLRRRLSWNSLSGCGCFMGGKQGEIAVLVGVRSYDLVSESFEGV